MKWVPPEMREDMGEIEASLSGNLPSLIEPIHVKGALHNHTTASDGTGSLSEMAEAAIDLGWEFLGIADHSEVLNIGGRSIGVPQDKVIEQGNEIREMNYEWEEEIQIFVFFMVQNVIS